MELPTGEAFRTEWIDFERGIRVGNLQPHERITQILKYHLESRHGTPFVMDRWGRGVFWQWICWLPRANREAKPISHDVNFSCAKFFVSVERETRVLKSGLQVERGYAVGPEPYRGCLLQRDWDWHRLMKQCGGGTWLDAELRRLVCAEGFCVEVGDFEANTVLTAENFDSARQLRDAAGLYAPDKWVGVQVYYPMMEREVGSCSGLELIRAICGVFAEVAPAMNACMTVPLALDEGLGRAV
ncbi:MAG: hypothetical protein N3B01_04665 [Verrucomicrobiae bacterium]|nr:hypothetical protein [Verrucomicrobiae bacterium]